MPSAKCKVQDNRWSENSPYRDHEGAASLRPPVGRPLTVAVRLVFCVLSLALLPSVSQAQSTRDTIVAVQPKVVKIFGAGGIKGLAAHGTGFFVSKEGHIVTIWSHVLDADLVGVVLSDGRRFSARVLGAEPQLALAVLKLNGAEGVEFPFFNPDDAVSTGTGTRVLGFSNMFNVAAGDEPVSVVHGVIAA